MYFLNIVFHCLTQKNVLSSKAETFIFDFVHNKAKHVSQGLGAQKSKIRNKKKVLAYFGVELFHHIQSQILKNQPYTLETHDGHMSHGTMEPDTLNSWPNSTPMLWVLHCIYVERE